MDKALKHEHSPQNPESVGMQRAIMLVDDEEAILNALSRDLESWAESSSLEIVLARSASEALEIFSREDVLYVAVISDLRMPGMKGSDLLVELKKLDPDLATFMLTGYSEGLEITKAVSSGISGILFKPWNDDYLTNELSKAIALRDMTIKTREEDARREKELLLAAELQRSFLAPLLPTTDKVSFMLESRPLHMCGGDYYDVKYIGRDSFAVMMGDVSGRGITAAMIAAIVKVIARDYFASLDCAIFAPAEFLHSIGAKLRSALSASSPSTHVTAIAGLLDLSSMTFSYACAGHEPPVLSRNGKASFLSSGGLPLCVSEKSEVSCFIKSLIPGDLLVLYTDGLVGGRASIAGKREKFLESLSGGASDSTYAEKAFDSASPLEDDASLLAIEIKNPDEDDYPNAEEI